jgi:hypothetical protein
MTDEVKKYIMTACKNTWNEKICKRIEEELEQQPCEDCISREYILSKAHCCCDDLADDEPCCVDADDIKGAPSVQPKPKMGHWKKLNVGYGCSECSLATNKSGVDFYRFCPNCGAKMESEDKK